MQSGSWRRSIRSWSRSKRQLAKREPVLRVDENPEQQGKRDDHDDPTTLGHQHLSVAVEFDPRLIADAELECDSVQHEVSHEDDLRAYSRGP